jgi:guanosine-3',5'-bis(diphosphate) 3'-pyrophosphohydrolase
VETHGPRGEGQKDFAQIDKKNLSLTGVDGDHTPAQRSLAGMFHLSLPAARPGIKIPLMTAAASDLQLVLRALAFAAHKHRDQRRKDEDASPYINHPIALANCLANEGGVTDPVVLVAALLHDTVEDTETTLEELTDHFGARISSIVGEVTDDKSLSRDRRKQAQIDHAPHLTLEARLVKLADKICNLRDVAGNPPAGWGRARKQEYFDWARRVVDGLRGVSPPLELAFDEAFSLRP